MSQVIDYPCDECGYDGPHSVSWDETLSQYVAECGECYVEFGVPAEAITQPTENLQVTNDQVTQVTSNDLLGGW